MSEDPKERYRVVPCLVAFVLIVLAGCVTRTKQPQNGSPSSETVWIWQDEFRQ